MPRTSPEMPTNPPALEKAVVGLWMAREGLIEALEAHNGTPAAVAAPCNCTQCEDAGGNLHMVRLMLANLESQIYTIDACLREHLEQAGFPSAGDLACMVAHWRRREAADDAEYRRHVEQAWNAEDERRRLEAGGGEGTGTEPEPV